MKKEYLIIPINIERSLDGMSFDEVIEAAKPLYKMTIAGLKELLMAERAEREK